MTSFNGYPISILLAVLLHGSVIAFLLYFQTANTEVLDAIRPPSVKANLVGENPQVKNALEQQQQQQRRVEQQQAEQRRQEEQRQTEARQQEEQRQTDAQRERQAEQERVALLERQNQEQRQAEQRQAEQRQADEQRERDQQQRQEREEQQREEQQRQQAEQAAQQERQRQEQALQAQQDAEASQIAAEESAAVMSYESVIHDLVRQQWSRPPSARNGMVAVLRISLLPTGDITDVQVVQSSGDFAFDRAAETAVLRVNRFTELQGMDFRLFDRNFRSFLLTFRPEDLLN